MKELLTSERIDELNKRIEENKKNPAPLMPTLQDAQRIFGCVPREIQEHIAEALNESYAKVKGVVTFYAMFSTEPKGKHVVRVCTGTACYVKGAKKLLDEVSDVLKTPDGGTTEDGEFSIAPTRCVGACGLAPVVTVDEDVHGNLSAADIKSIIKEYQTKN